MIFPKKQSPMDSSPQLLLNLWREVSLHILIDESVTRVMPLLSPELPLERFWSGTSTWREPLWRQSPRRWFAPAKLLEGAKTECTPEDLGRILAWCREGPLLRAGDRPIQKQLPGLLPADLAGHFLVAPLNGSENILGVLVLRARSSVSFGEEHEALVRDLVDPFTVALENDQRVRELFRCVRLLKPTIGRCCRDWDGTTSRIR